MIIVNERFGFATNSSSLHSIVYFPNATRQYQDNRDPDEIQYGRERFTLSTRRAKLNYLAIHLRGSLKRAGASDEDWRRIVRRECLNDISDEVTAETDDFWDSGFIDHQSRLDLPINPKTGNVDIWFFRKLRDYCLDDDVLILGGSDEHDRHAIWQREEQGSSGFKRWALRSFPFCEGGDYWSRRNHWTDAGGIRREGVTLFAPRGSRGHKIRFLLTDSMRRGGWGFYDKPRDPNLDGYQMTEQVDLYDYDNPPKLQAPELVDLHLTSKCPFRCSFCYQSSLPSGEHADYAHVVEVIDVLAENKVFEVAIGGGEPTMYPDFAKLLGYIRGKNIVPNFTTRNLAWMGNEEMVQAVDAYCGGFAYSLHSPSEFPALLEALDSAPETSVAGIRSKISIQVIMGTFSQDDLAGVMELCGEHGIPLTLLGFKDVGFGKDHGRTHDYTDWGPWLESVLESPWARRERLRAEGHEVSDTDDGPYPNARWCRVGIDTALASEWAEHLKGSGIVRRRNFSVVEGDCSMYIDAVGKTCASSSYAPKEMARTYESASDLMRHWMALPVWSPATK